MYPKIHLFDFTIDSYQLSHAVGIIVVIILLHLEFKRNKYSPLDYFILIFVTLMTGIIGSKIYYLLLYWDKFIRHPSEFIFSPAGSGWYGGLILGILSILIVSRLKHIPPLHVLDIITTILPLGQAFGRLGCFLAGCCRGIPTSVPWAMSFPNGALPTSDRVHPTQLYEMIIYLCVFLLLWKLRKKNLKDGSLFSLYLILAGLGRFIIEFIRLTPKTSIYLTIPQIFALAGILTGCYMLIMKRDKDKLT